MLGQDFFKYSGYKSDMQNPAQVTSPKTFRYYDLIMAAFVTILLCSNLIGATKIFTFAGRSFSAGILFFPLSYLFGDILTEVYGYARSRKVVWAGFSAMAFASLMAWLVLRLKPAPNWHDQAAFETVFGSTYRILIASLGAYFFGEFANSYTLAKMKIFTQGKWLWTRFIGSTIIGEAVDSLIFYPLAFYGVFPNDLLVEVMVSNYFFKVLWETFMVPFTYKVVAFLKRAEGEDFYDYHTNFTPFSLKT